MIDSENGDDDDDDNKNKQIIEAKNTIFIYIRKHTKRLPYIGMLYTKIDRWFDII